MNTYRHSVVANLTIDSRAIDQTGEGSFAPRRSYPSTVGLSRPLDLGWSRTTNAWPWNYGVPPGQKEGLADVQMWSNVRILQTPARLKELDIPRFRPHDLRATVATEMDALGVTKDSIYL